MLTNVLEKLMTTTLCMIWSHIHIHTVHMHMELCVGMFLAEVLMCGHGGKSQAPASETINHRGQQGLNAGPSQSIIGYKAG